MSTCSSSGSNCFMEEDLLRYEARRKESKYTKRRRRAEIKQFGFDMSTWGPHQSAFITLLEQACSGEDESMGKPATDTFWRNFCTRLTIELNLYPKPSINSCVEYASYLRTLYREFKNPRSVAPVNKQFIEIYPEDEKKKIISIFGHCPPVLSRRKSQACSSRNTNSSGKRSFDCVSVSGSAPNSDLHKALGELVFAGKLKFEDVPEAEKMVTKTEIQLRVFLVGSLDERAQLLETMMKKQKVNYMIEETEGFSGIPDSIIPYS